MTQLKIVIDDVENCQPETIKKFIEILTDLLAKHTNKEQE